MPTYTKSAQCAGWWSLVRAWRIQRDRKQQRIHLLLLSICYQVDISPVPSHPSKLSQSRPTSTPVHITHYMVHESLIPHPQSLPPVVVCSVYSFHPTWGRDMGWVRRKWVGWRIIWSRFCWFRMKMVISEAVNQKKGLKPGKN